jgi:hypothetical protein
MAVYIAQTRFKGNFLIKKNCIPYTRHYGIASLPGIVGTHPVKKCEIGFCFYKDVIFEIIPPPGTNAKSVVFIQTLFVI